MGAGAICAVPNLGTQTVSQQALLRLSSELDSRVDPPPLAHRFSKCAPNSNYHENTSGNVTDPGPVFVKAKFTPVKKIWIKESQGSAQVPVPASAHCGYLDNCPWLFSGSQSLPSLKYWSHKSPGFTSLPALGTRWGKGVRWKERRQASRCSKTRAA